MQIRIDTTGDVPTADDCRRYGIRSMSQSEGGSAPVELVLDFDSALARDDALRFLREWMGSDDPEGDLAVALA
jgi:hypothetical protein